MKLPDLEEDNCLQITNMDNIRKQTSLFRRTTVIEIKIDYIGKKFLIHIKKKNQEITSDTLILNKLIKTFN